MNFIEQLQMKDSTLCMFLDSMYDAVYVVDKERKIVYWNTSAENMTGFKKEDVMNKRCSDDILNHIDENGILICRSACPIVKVMKSGNQCSLKVYPKAKNDKRFPVETHVSPIRNENGEIIGAIEVFRDISVFEEYRILQEKFNNLIRKYVSTTTYDEVLSRIHSSNQTNEPRLLDLSVLYLDVVDFTGFSEKNSPQIVVKMLNDLFGLCEVITKECYGDIDKFIGDAIMAIFSDANDAVNSALKIVHIALADMNKIRLENNEQPISIRIGINSGILLQGDIGTIDRKDLTVIGDTVNTAARIEKAAPKDKILISEATMSRLNKNFAKRFIFFEMFQLKGKKELIKTFVSVD
jgi:PAS domain S-box-containing protein